MFILLATACNDKKKSKDDLVLKDSLLYEIGRDEPFTGTEKSDIEGKVIEYEVVDGYKQGKFKIYYQDGSLEMSGTMEKNLNVGKWQYYYPGGKIESEGNFVKNFPEGRWKWYYPSGVIKEEGEFFKGIRMGEWKIYNIEGKLDSTIHFAADDSSKLNKENILNSTN